MNDMIFYVLMIGSFTGFVFSLYRYLRPSNKNIWADEKRLKEFLSWNYLDENMLVNELVLRLPESFIHGLILHLFGMAALSSVYFLIYHVDKQLTSLIEFQLWMVYFFFMGMHFMNMNKQKKLVALIDLDKVRMAVKERKTVPPRISLTNNYPVSRFYYGLNGVLYISYLIWTGEVWPMNILLGLAVAGLSMFALKITDNIPFSYQFVKDEKRWEHALAGIKRGTVFFIMLLTFLQFVLLGLLQKQGELLL